MSCLVASRGDCGFWGVTGMERSQRRRGLGDNACVVDGITGSSQGRGRRIKGLDHGLKQQRRGSGEVDDDADSMGIFGGKFWQPDGLSESLLGLWFANAAQRFIYRGTTTALSTGDVSHHVATEVHSSDGRLPS
jgi:hypothetical protein